MQITSMNWLEYFIVFSGHNNALSDRYVRESDKYSLLFSAKIDGAYAGYLCLAPENGYLKISYAFTLPEYRRQGVFTELVRFAKEKTKVPLRLCVLAGHEFNSVVTRVCLRQGFVRGESVRVFTSRRENYPLWLDFMERKGKRLCAFLEHRGYQAVSFADADEDLIRQLKESTVSEYANPLDPSLYLEIPEKNLFREMSYAAVKDGRLAAYTMVVRASATKVVFEHISDSAPERGSGCILLPFAKAMEAFGESDCQMVSYAMYGSNSHANAFRTKLLDVLNSDSVESENYYYRK